ncbi:FkbM family methyltransferase [Leptothoe sp. LEGE 181152]|nr:FkbM family methyltransferase [Leptothoe sp. LEGE 181152]
MLTKIQHQLLRAWGSTGIAPGWHYQQVENFGARLDKDIVVQAKLPNGLALPCNIKDHVQRQIYFHGVYEPIESYLFTRLLEPGMTVIDAGANIGQYSLLASGIVGKMGKVHSFEPIDQTFSILENNILKNNISNVILHQCGLWDSDSSVSLGLSPEMSDNIGSYSIGVYDGCLKSDVRVVALDEYRQEASISSVDFIKMDIEGAEYNALLGMQKTVEENQPIFLIEINLKALNRLKTSPRKILDYFLEQNYKGYFIDLSGFRKVTVESIQTVNQKNAIFLPSLEKYELKIAHMINHDFPLKEIFQWAMAGYEKNRCL